MVFTFFGQLTGTSVGAKIYSEAGWVGSQSYSVASIGVGLIITLARGPWEKGWIGWNGGLSIFKKDKTSSNGIAKEERNVLRRLNTNEQREKVQEEERKNRDDGETVGDSDEHGKISESVEKVLEEEAAEEKDESEEGNSTATTVEGDLAHHTRKDET